MVPNIGVATVTRESRPAYSAGRLPICQLGGDDQSHTQNLLQRQCLERRHGISGNVSGLLAQLVWGAQRNG